MKNKKAAACKGDNKKCKRPHHSKNLCALHYQQRRNAKLRADRKAGRISAPKEPNTASISYIKVECDNCINWYPRESPTCPKCGSKNYEFIDRLGKSNSFNTDTIINYDKKKNKDID